MFRRSDGKIGCGGKRISFAGTERRASTTAGGASRRVSDCLAGHAPGVGISHGVGGVEEAESRAVQTAKVPQIDTRSIFLRETNARISGGPRTHRANNGRQGGQMHKLQLTRNIHADWLMAVREDLGNCTPRQVLLANRKHIDQDIEHRSQQWSRQGRPPVPLEDNEHFLRLWRWPGTNRDLFRPDPHSWKWPGNWRSKCPIPRVRSSFRHCPLTEIAG